MRDGWYTATLKDLCVVDWGNTNLTKSAYVEDGAFLAVSAAGCDGRIGHKEHSKGTPVLSAIGAQCGKMFFLEEDFTAIKNTITLTPRPNVCDGKFLYYLFTFVKLPQRGAGQPFISKGDIQSFSVSIPSLSEQKRIVAILDEAFAGIAAATANAEKNLANARELFENYLNSVFTGGVGWTQKKLGDRDLLQVIDGDRGANYPNKTEFSEQGHCLFLNTKNVRPDGFSFETTMFISQEKDCKLRNGKLKRRDVVLTTRGTIGNVALYDDSVGYENVRINSGMLIFRPNERLLLSEFLFEVFRSGIMKNQIDKFVTGAAQPQLPIQTLVNFVIPVPDSLDDQKQIVANLRALFSKARHLADIYQRKLDALAKLKQAILQKAFSGELTALPGAEMQEEAA